MRNAKKKVLFVAKSSKRLCEGLFYAILFCISSTCFAISPSGTTVPPATEIFDSNGGLWTVTSGICYLNNVRAGNCSNVQTLLFYQGAIYVGSTQSTWWLWNGSGWVQVPLDPRLGTSSSGGISLDSTVWGLAIDQDFTTGDAPSLYSAFCGPQGGAGGANNNNFSMQNVYWANGALTLKFEKRVNTSCTGITRNYAGGGFFLNTPAATSIAVEFEIMDNNVYGVSPYAGLFIAGGVNPSCGWGAEDDFFERLGGSQSQEVQTYHFWTPSCVHGVDQAFKTIPDIASTYHTYSVIRDGGTAFFVDGVAQLTNGGNNVANYVSSDDFMSYPMTVQMGVGGYNWALPNDSQLPAYVYVRHIKVWYKNP